MLFSFWIVSSLRQALPEPEQPEPVKRTAPPPVNRKRNTVRTPSEPDPMDAHYDGYYDGVPPIDADRVEERVGSALIKRITWVIPDFLYRRNEFGEPQFSEIQWHTDRRPIGYHSLTAFLVRRKAPKHRKHIQQLLKRYGYDDLDVSTSDKTKENTAEKWPSGWMRLRTRRCGFWKSCRRWGSTGATAS